MVIIYWYTTYTQNKHLRTMNRMKGVQNRSGFEFILVARSFPYSSK